jgi:uncharacterized protein
VKSERLKKILKELGSVVVAYSGGVDSTFLLKMAKEVLGKDKVFAVTAKSEVFPEWELKDAKKNARKLGIEHIVIGTEELKNKNFVKNPTNRCYYCKKELFSRLKDMANDKKLSCVIDGANLDDLKDFRFGRKAAKELGVRSPLIEAGFGKKEIRDLSKRLRLPTWNKSTFACLASRFPYGRRIDKKALMRVKRLEVFLKSFGFKQVRVRIHGNLARIEIELDDIKYIVNRKVRKKIVDKFKRLGFTYVALDLGGYRSGSMNEALRQSRA